MAGDPVLLVTRNFPPLLGGMEKLNHRLLAGLAGPWSPILCGPTGAATHVPEGVEVVEAPLVPLWRFLGRSLVAAVRRARWRRPRWVIAGSGLTAPVAWVAARSSGARCAVYLHGLDLVAPHRVYQAIWLPFIRRCDLVFANSANTASLARSRGVRGDRVHVVNPGVDALPSPAPDVPAREQWGLGRRPMLVSVGRFTRRKGLAEFVRDALPRVLDRVPDAVLVVVGGEASDALHGAHGDEQSRIERAAADAGVSHAVKFVGRCDQPVLESALADATCHVFPVLDLPGDVEGFGMVALEAASFGLETVAFRVGGVPDAVEEGQSGRLVAPGDYTGFADAVVGILRQGRTSASEAACRGFARTRSWEEFSARIHALLVVHR